MVLIPQSNTNDDSQSRQLRVSKKLSKAISSVPRSRFQKPRPNLPGSKRTEIAVPATVHKTNEASENNHTIKTENLSTKENPQNDDTHKTSVNSVLDTRKTSQSSDTLKVSEKFKADEISQNGDTVKYSENTEENSQNDDALKNSLTLNADEAFQVKEKRCEHLDTNEIFQNDDTFKNSLIIDETSENSSVKISQNLNSNETSYSDDTLHSINTESVQDLVDETPVLNCTDSTDTPPFTTVNNTDKSSKYPHLTSILSKKRPEPKKEVQHKKRKKFKKGEAAPERSKMTMADLIYWNPTNTDQPSRSNTTEDEILTNSNFDEPEECLDADTPVEENNIQDSVPKLVISEDGSINIDQSSLVVSRNILQPTSTEVIRKDDTTYSSFRKRPMTKHWTAKDTTIFYKALSLVGTDFGLMEKIFPHRTRRELKLKFKREEKYNIDLINRAMYESHLTFDANTLGDLIKNLNDLTGDFSSENTQEDTQSSNKEKKKETTRKRKIKSAKSVDTDSSDYVTESNSNEVKATNDDKVRAKRSRKAKKIPEDFMDTQEIDDIVLMDEEVPEENCNEAACELNSAEIIAEESSNNEVKTQTPISNSELDGICETTNIEILCIDDFSGVDLNSGVEGSKAIFVPKDASDLSQVIIQDGSSGNVSETISFANNNEQEQCITLEYVEDVNQANNLTLLNNVMAFEVVSSNTPIPRRRRKVNFTPNVPKKFKKSCQPLQVSSTNYTPV